MPRCFYCGEAIEGTPDPEHILPAAIGCELTTRRVHTACNHRAGHEIDRPWLQYPFVRQARQYQQVVDRRGEVVAPLHYEGKLVGSDIDAVVTLDEERITVRPRPQQFDDGDTKMMIGYSQEELALRLARERETNPAVEILWSHDLPGDALSAQVNWELSVDTWPRFGAKVALGVASLLVEDDWLDEPEAVRLRQVVWNGHDDSRIHGPANVGIAWSAAPLVMSPPRDLGLRAGEHLLVFEETPEEGRWLVIATLQVLGYRVPLQLDRSKRIDRDWYFTPAMPKGDDRFPGGALYAFLDGRRDAES